MLKGKIPHKNTSRRLVSLLHTLHTFRAIKHYLVKALGAAVVVLGPNVVGVTPGDDGELRKDVHGSLGKRFPDGSVAVSVPEQISF